MPTFTRSNHQRKIQILLLSGVFKGLAQMFQATPQPIVQPWPEPIEVRLHVIDLLRRTFDVKILDADLRDAAPASTPNDRGYTGGGLRK